MPETITAREITLKELEEKFNLKLETDPNFFREWQENLPKITDLPNKLLYQFAQKTIKNEEIF